VAANESHTLFRKLGSGKSQSVKGDSRFKIENSRLNRSYLRQVQGKEVYQSVKGDSRFKIENSRLNRLYLRQVQGKEVYQSVKGDSRFKIEDSRLKIKGFQSSIFNTFDKLSTSL
jgi:hypothetical protein